MWSFSRTFVPSGTPNTQSFDRKIFKALEDEYFTQSRDISPHEVGRPQSRKRWFLVGIRKDQFTGPFQWPTIGEERADQPDVNIEDLLDTTGKIPEGYENEGLLTDKQTTILDQALQAIMSADPPGNRTKTPFIS